MWKPVGTSNKAATEDNIDAQRTASAHTSSEIEQPEIVLLPTSGTYNYVGRVPHYRLIFRNNSDNYFQTNAQQIKFILLSHVLHQ